MVKIESIGPIRAMFWLELNFWLQIVFVALNFRPLALSGKSNGGEYLKAAGGREMGGGIP